jgi:tyrosine-protein phosphatase SIW14
LSVRSVALFAARPKSKRAHAKGKKGPSMPRGLRWLLGLAIAAAIPTTPVVYYRWAYVQSKRLREVNPGLVYRSGQMTSSGIQQAVSRYHIRTIVNLQDEYPDPDVACGYFCGGTIKEKELCRQLGVRYVYLPPDLIPRVQVPPRRPEAIDRFLGLLDDPTVYPVLIHCRAGLNRTGVMTAVYRMEYQGWTPRQALAEARANGWGEWTASAANDYIYEYILSYEPGRRHSQPVVQN